MKTTELEGRVEKLEEHLQRLRRGDTRRRRTARSLRRAAVGVVAASAIAIPLAAYSLEPVPNPPVADAPIVADDLAANFQHLVDAVSTNEGRLDAAETRLDALDSLEILNLESAAGTISSGACENMFTPAANEIYLVIAHTQNPGSGGNNVNERVTALVRTDSSSNIGIDTLDGNVHTIESNGAIVRSCNGHPSFDRSIGRIWVNLSPP